MRNVKLQAKLSPKNEIEGESEISNSPARHILRPNFNSTATISSFQPIVPHADLTTMLDELEVQTCRVWSGNLERAEEMLSAQAHALDAIFNTLAQKAAATMKSGHMPSTEIYLKMAMKAQSQCRATLEALAEIKAPKSATFIRQANIAEKQQVNIAEQQQLNNGLPVNRKIRQLRPRAREKKVNIPSNELLEVDHGKRMDSRTAGEAISNDSQLEAVEQGNGAPNRSRKNAK